MMIVSTFTLLVLVSESNAGTNSANNEKHACASEASGTCGKGSSHWHEQLKVQVALPDTWLEKTLQILHPLQIRKHWEVGRDVPRRADFSRGARVCVGGTALQAARPWGRPSRGNTCEKNSWNWMQLCSRVPMLTEIKQSFAAMTAEVVFI